jgi:hypothetical protein
VMRAPRRRPARGGFARRRGGSAPAASACGLPRAGWRGGCGGRGRRLRVGNRGGGGRRHLLPLKLRRRERDVSLAACFRSGGAVKLPGGDESDRQGRWGVRAAAGAAGRARPVSPPHVDSWQFVGGAAFGLLVGCFAKYVFFQPLQTEGRDCGGVLNVRSL